MFGGNCLGGGGLLAPRHRRGQRRGDKGGHSPSPPQRDPAERRRASTAPSPPGWRDDSAPRATQVHAEAAGDEQVEHGGDPHRQKRERETADGARLTSTSAQAATGARAAHRARPGTGTRSITSATRPQASSAIPTRTRTPARAPPATGCTPMSRTGGRPGQREVHDSGSHGRQRQPRAHRTVPLGGFPAERDCGLWARHQPSGCRNRGIMGGCPLFPTPKTGPGCSSARAPQCGFDASTFEPGEVAGRIRDERRRVAGGAGAAGCRRAAEPRCLVRRGVRRARARCAAVVSVPGGADARATIRPSRAGTATRSRCPTGTASRSRRGWRPSCSRPPPSTPTCSTRCRMPPGRAPVAAATASRSPSRRSRCYSAHDPMHHLWDVRSWSAFAR